MRLGEFLLVVVMTIPFLVLAILGSRSQRNEKLSLLKSGELSEAEILGYTREEFHVVRYRFKADSRAEPVEAEMIIAHWDDQFPIGSTHPVRYRSKFPKMSVLVPYVRK